MTTKPIVIIDDDDDDLKLIKQAFTELKVNNEIIDFNDGYKFLDFIRETDIKTFFILCDINMQKIGGLELKKMISDDERLRLKCIPFLFFSTSMASPAIERAYSYNVQGFFVKPNNFQTLKAMMKTMVEYWDYSVHPNS